MATQPTVRGTQTFVGVMSAVWRRPSLAGLEILWRWLAGGLLLIILLPVLLGSLGMEIHLTGIHGAATAPSISALSGITVFQPVAAIQTIDATLLQLIAPARYLLRTIIPVAMIAWLLIATFGRTLVLRRLDPTLQRRWMALWSLTVLRLVALSFAWYLWFSLLGWASRVSITGPAAHGEEPGVVLFCAIIICGTLGLYVLWAIVSWPLQLAPLLAMRNNTGALAGLRAALASKGELRSKLIETNLVMCIVRIALIVLAMVLSASPLAFQTVATQEFFVVWWAIAVLLYFAASDYFHVVRSAAYLALWKSV